MGIVLIGLVSAITIYAGESYSFESEEFEYYTVIGNSSNLEGMNVSWENGDITISFSKYFAPDSFTLIFFNQETEIITEHHYSSGGGSSSTKYVDKIIEVPNYIDREVIKEIEKEVPSEPEIIKEKPIWKWVYWFLPSLILLLIIYLIAPKDKWFKKKKQVEDGNIKRESSV